MPAMPKDTLIEPVNFDVQTCLDINRLITDKYGEHWAIVLHDVEMSAKMAHQKAVMHTVSNRSSSFTAWCSLVKIPRDGGKVRKTAVVYTATVHVGKNNLVSIFATPLWKVDERVLAVVDSIRTQNSI